jgi:hypothetical protein
MQTRASQQQRHWRDPDKSPGYPRPCSSTTNRAAQQSNVLRDAGSFAIAAQAVEVEDGDPAIFEPQQALLLQPLQALVGVLPGDA